MALLDAGGFGSTNEGLIAAQECLRANETRDAFAADFSVLARIWEAVSPDPGVTQHEKDYRWLVQGVRIAQALHGHRPSALASPRREDDSS